MSLAITPHKGEMDEEYQETYQFIYLLVYHQSRSKNLIENKPFKSFEFVA